MTLEKKQKNMPNAANQPEPSINKGAALLSHKIGDKWTIIHQLTISKYSHIWISFSLNQNELSLKESDYV